LVWMVVSGELFMAIFTVLHLVAAASSLPCLPRPQGSHDVAEVRVPTCRDAEILAALTRALRGRAKDRVLVMLRVGISEDSCPVLLQVGDSASACEEAAGAAASPSAKLVVAWLNRACEWLPRLCARRMRAAAKSRVAVVVQFPDPMDQLLGLPVSRSIGALPADYAPFSLVVSRSDEHVFFSAAGNANMGPGATEKILAAMARELHGMR